MGFAEGLVGTLLRHPAEVLLQGVWEGPQESAFLTGSQVMSLRTTVLKCGSIATANRRPCLSETQVALLTLLAAGQPLQVTHWSIHVVLPSLFGTRFLEDS